MKIIIVAPKIIRTPTFRLDYAFWNFYLPLLSLGHETYFFDSSIFGDEHLKVWIENVKPDLLFCVMTGNKLVCPNEPWETITEETEKGNTTTFNWFCDDTWRFESFSKKICTKFHYCSTPEKDFVSKYRDFGYSNISYATWHANAEIYSNLLAGRTTLLSFCGSTRGDRAEYLEVLAQNDMAVNIPEDPSIESMLWAYSSSMAGLNFSKNSVNDGTQMKARMFEVPATGAVLLTEYHDNLENCFDVGEEILTFSSSEELVERVNQLKDINFAREVGVKGFKRFANEHSSRVRLAVLLQEIFS